MINEQLVSETLRYLGIRSSVDEQFHNMVLTAIDRVEQCASFRFIYDENDLQVEDDRVILNDHVIKSRDLAKHLKGCKTLYIIAATLGSDVDRLLARDAVVHPAMATVQQAAATALIEQYCDEACLKLEGTLTKDLHLLSRFSPGYGDCSLEEQVYCLQLLNAARRIGLTYTDSYMLSPLKSITAFIGVSSNLSCSSKGCALCTKSDCQFRT